MDCYMCLKEKLVPFNEEDPNSSWLCINCGHLVSSEEVKKELRLVHKSKKITIEAHQS